MSQAALKLKTNWLVTALSKKDQNNKNINKKMEK